MTQNAVVKELSGDGWATIEVRRVSACGHDCSQCGGGCAELAKSGPVTVLARNPVGARPGDRVVVESATKSILGFAAVVYLLPLVLFFAGYFIASALGCGEGTAIALGSACFAVSLAIAVLVDRRAAKHSRELFSIVSVLPG